MLSFVNFLSQLITLKYIFLDFSNFEVSRLNFTTPLYSFRRHSKNLWNVLKFSFMYFLGGICLENGKKKLFILRLYNFIYSKNPNPIQIARNRAAISLYWLIFFYSTNGLCSDISRALVECTLCGSLMLVILVRFFSNFNTRSA